jgi:hypothetical protein
LANPVSSQRVSGQDPLEDAFWSSRSEAVFHIHLAYYLEAHIAVERTGFSNNGSVQGALWEKYAPIGSAVFLLLVPCIMPEGRHRMLKADVGF